MAISSSRLGSAAIVLDLRPRRWRCPSTSAGLELQRRDVLGEVRQGLGQGHRVGLAEGHGRRAHEVLLELRPAAWPSMARRARVFLTTRYSPPDCRTLLRSSVTCGTVIPW